MLLMVICLYYNGRIVKKKRTKTIPLYCRVTMTQHSLNKNKKERKGESKLIFYNFLRKKKFLYFFLGAFAKLNLNLWFRESELLYGTIYFQLQGFVV